MEAVVANPALVITIDIANRTVSAPEIGLVTEFPLDDFTQFRLLEGLDDIGLTLRHEADITAFEARRPAWLPVSTHASPGS